jgi:hypothetical protein
MTDATSGAGEDRKTRTTGDPGAHSPLVTPTETEAPVGERRESVPGGSGDGGFGGAATPGRDKTSGLGRETGRRERERNTGSDAVGGVGVGTGVGGAAGHQGHEGHGHEGQGHEAHGHEARLLPHDECDKLSTRLQHAVAGFVDEPRSAVEEADHVLEEVATRFTEAVKERRRTLRTSWQAGEGGQNKAVSTGDTEQLRLALRDYRELAERLLHS